MLTRCAWRSSRGLGTCTEKCDALILPFQRVVGLEGLTMARSQPGTSACGKKKLPCPCCSAALSCTRTLSPHLLYHLCPALSSTLAYTYVSRIKTCLGHRVTTKALILVTLLLRALLAPPHAHRLGLTALIEGNCELQKAVASRTALTDSHQGLPPLAGSCPHHCALPLDYKKQGSLRTAPTGFRQR